MPGQSPALGPRPSRSVPTYYSGAQEPEERTGSDLVREFLSCSNNSTLLRRFARRLIDCPVAAEDVVQEAMVLMLQLERGPTCPERVRQWCCRVVAYVALHHRRSLARRKHHESQARLNIHTSTESLERTLLARGVLHAWSRRLGSSEWNLLMQRYFMGEPTEQLAESMGVSEAAIRMRLSRLRRHLFE